MEAGMSDTKEVVQKILQNVQRIKRGRIPYKPMPRIVSGMRVKIQIGHSTFIGTAVADSYRGFVSVSYIGPDGSEETRSIRLRLVTRIQE